jgi:gamma-glutamylcyclotransferase (GGCT)/AIG2-like uncharacterized protein YtfP
LSAIVVPTSFSGSVAAASGIAVDSTLGTHPLRVFWYPSRVLVFVYGTLMRGAANHGVLVRLGARCEGEARTREPRTLVDLGPYPALLPADERDRTPVEGELYRVDEAAIGELDAFEGCPTLYRREAIAVVAGRAEREAETYVLARRAPAHARVLATGRYDRAGRALDEGARDVDLDPDDDGFTA